MASALVQTAGADAQSVMLSAGKAAAAAPSAPVSAPTPDGAGEVVEEGGGNYSTKYYLSFGERARRAAEEDGRCGRNVRYPLRSPSKSPERAISPQSTNGYVRRCGAKCLTV